jgi:hypothetical protein
MLSETFGLRGVFTAASAGVSSCCTWSGRDGARRRRVTVPAYSILAARSLIHTMPTPTLATNDEHGPLSADRAETAIETGSLLYRFERDDEQFAVFETPEEPFVGWYTMAESAPRTIGSATEIADAAVI